MAMDVHSGEPLGSALDGPHGGFQWTDEWRARLPVMRGVRTMEFPPLEALLAQPPLGRHLHDRGFDLFDARRYAWPWTQWQPDEAARAMTPGRLQLRDEAAWAELLVQVCLGGLYIDRLPGQPWHPGLSGPVWVVTVGAALHGLDFMLAVADGLERQHPTAYERCRMRGVASALGALVASVPDDEHARAMAWLEAHPPATAEGRLHRALMCPHRSDWALACHAEAKQPVEALCMCVLPLDVVMACQQAIDPDTCHGQLPWHLVLQLHLHGAAVLPLVADLLRRAGVQAMRQVLVDFALQIHDPQLLPLLAALPQVPEARAALDGLVSRWPLAVLLARWSHARSARAPALRRLFLRRALADRALLQRLQQALPAAERAVLDDWLAALQPPEAAALPAVLVRPPWLAPAPAPAWPEVPAEAPASPWQMVLDDGEAARLSKLVETWQPREPEQLTWRLYELGIPQRAHHAVLHGQPLHAPIVERDSRSDRQRPTSLLSLPDEGMRAVWNPYPAEQWKFKGDSEAAVRAVLMRLGEAAAPGLVNLVRAQPLRGFACARGVDCAGLVPLALAATRRSQREAQAAWAWITGQLPLVLAHTLPLAFGGPSELREAARHVLLEGFGRGHAAAIEAAAVPFGPAMQAAVQQVQSAADTPAAPARLPRLPAFVAPEVLPRPRLRDGDGALPLPALQHLLTMLMLGTLARPYPALAAVREACTPSSLADLALALFDDWLFEGAPPAAMWVLHTQAWLGGDAAVSRLGPLVRAWPGESAAQRAIQGADVLAAIGSDLALLHLHALAGQRRFKPLAAHARRCIEQIAAARGLDEEALADRAVPDLGLDERGTLVLDHGARSFSVGFDEHLQPWVRDASGQRLPGLPRRGAGDDAERVKAAAARLRQLKQDARTTGTALVARLQAAMLARRRWSAAEFRSLFVQHPFSRHVAARLVWGAYDADGRLCAVCRIAEDGTLADAADRAWSAADGLRFGIVHPIELDEATRSAFGQLLGDYELVQPFPQLQRETFRLAEAERSSGRLVRFADAVVTEGLLTSLQHRGWQGEGAVWRKPVAPGLQAELALRWGPGGGVSFGAGRDHRLEAIVLTRPAGDGPAPRFGELDDFTVSELLRDVWRLAEPSR